MEHLPTVSNPDRPLFIPYVADHNHESFDFSNFHNPRGLDINLLLVGESQGFSPEQIGSFLQTWLYFGVMREVFQVDIRTEDFVRTDKSGKWITTEKLPEYLRIFREQVEQERLLENKVEIFEVRNTRVYNCLRTTRACWSNLVDLEDNPLSQEAWFGIQVLAITLEVAATEICGLGRGLIYPGEVANQPGYREVPWKHDILLRLTPNAFIEERLRERNWCPVVSHQIQQEFNVLGQYYVSLFKAPTRQLDHSQCSKFDKDCKGYYGFAGFGKHLATGCSCDTIEVDNIRLAEIIQNGEIPVLHFDEETNSLDILSSKSLPELEYVALSHVWSDGWGNPRENSLSLCRINQLVAWMKATYSNPDFKVQKDVGSFQRLSDFQMQSSSGRWQRASSYSLPSSDGSWVQPADRGFVGKLYFWMDTLCVPRAPKEIHNKAVMQMRNVYEEAERVLVLDAELLSSTATASYEEINMLIQSSRWIRRLWTVQEAALARRLIFQFSDGSIINASGSKLWHVRQMDLQTNYSNSIGWDCFTSFDNYLRIKDPVLRLGYIWKILLASRSVTMVSDEPICGAILMDFDLEYILATPPKQEQETEDDEEDHEIVTEAETYERMRRFWELHTSHVPVPILFAPGAKLPIEGFKWAPASLMSCVKTGPDTEFIGSISKSWITDSWGGRSRWILNSLLRIPLAPVIGLAVNLPPRKAFLLAPPPKSEKPATSLLSCELDGHKYIIRPGFETPDFSDVVTTLSEAKQLAVIIELMPSMEEPVEGGKSEIWGLEATRAALVVVQRRGWFTWTAQYIRLIGLVREGSHLYVHPRVPYSEADLEQMSRPPLKASWRTKEERWCLV